MPLALSAFAAGLLLRVHVAAEIGHYPLPWMTADEHPGPACWCGRRGSRARRRTSRYGSVAWGLPQRHAGIALECFAEVSDHCLALVLGEERLEPPDCDATVYGPPGRRPRSTNEPSLREVFRHFFAFEEFEEGATTGRYVAHFIGIAKLVHRRYAIAAADQ